MSIRLLVEKYCQNCSEFEADVEKTNFFSEASMRFTRQRFSVNIGNVARKLRNI